MATTFNSFNKAPGVYIEEITLPGPLPQVSTSVAAFVGPAQMGPLNQPTLLTSVKQFNTIFGSYIETPYRCYAAHAINGFFNEGGQQCYFVRVGNGKQAWLNLLDSANLDVTVTQSTTLSAAEASGSTTISVTSATGFAVGGTITIAQGATTENATITAVSGTTITLGAGLANAYPSGTTVEVVVIPAQNTTLVATALQEGNPITATTVKVDPASIAQTTTVPGTTLSAASTTNTVTVASVANFQPGDVVTIATGATTENATIAGINTTAKVFTFAANLANSYPSGSIVSMVGLAAAATSIRVVSVSGFQPGSYVQFSTGSGPATNFSYDVVRVVNPVTNVLTITNGLTLAYPAGTTVNIASMEFKLTVKSANAGTEVFSNLAMDPRHSQYYANIVDSQAITLAPPPQPDTTPPPLNLPSALAAASLAGGAADNLNTLPATAYQAGVDTLKKYDVDLLCVPDAVTTWPTANSHFQPTDTQSIQAYMVAHCEQMQDRFAILDASEATASAATFTPVLNQRAGLNSENGYAGLYFPWIGIQSPFGSGTIFVPPSGHTAGVYANNDNTYDVAHAPANEPIVSALSVEALLSDADQGPLNQQGINVIRSFPSQGILVWGARTIAPPDQSAWMYINVRRLLIYIEKTIREGTRFAVFQPNNITLWQQVKRIITDFLMQLWTAGDLFGATPALAFQVRVDATLNTPAVVAMGQMIAQITVVPTHPAEFVVFQVIQDPTGASLQESTS
jgi:phage tail sheath protein FI